jgi:hypothetical protein
MFSRHQRSWSPGAALAALALLLGPGLSRAQDVKPAAGEAFSGAPHKPETVLRSGGAGRPPAPGQLVNPGAREKAGEPRRRVPPILIAFVLLFLITWVRTYLERRRLRASFRQSCEPTPPQAF